MAQRLTKRPSPTWGRRLRRSRRRRWRRRRSPDLLRSCQEAGDRGRLRLIEGLPRMKTYRFLLISFFCGGRQRCGDHGNCATERDGKPIAEREGEDLYRGYARWRFNANVSSSCWADCAKSAQTNADGNFRIADVSDNLVFRLLVFAKGYAPEFAAKIDPRNGATKVQIPEASAQMLSSSFKSEPIRCVRAALWTGSRTGGRRA